MSKFSHTSKSKVFFVSDLHQNHNRDFIYLNRGYNSVEEHDFGNIKIWNERVTNNDIVFHLGDTVFGQGAEQRLIELLKTLNFSKIFLLPGNHTSGFSQLRKRYGNLMEIEGEHKKLVHFTSNLYEISVEDQFINLCHFPLASWNHMKTGAWCLCGHEHGQYIPSRPESNMGKILDVGIELFGGPISFDEVKVIMDKKDIFSIGHH